MRKALLSVALVLLSSLPAYAQDVAGGVKVGVNFANIEFDPDPPEDVDFKSLTGLAGGGYVTLPIGPVFAIQPEALVIQKGTKLDVGGVTSKFKLTYLEVPILARIGTDAFNVFGGPAFAFKLDSELELEGDDVQLEEDFDDEDIKGTDFGIIAGVGFGSSRFNVDLRFTWGITNINDDPTDVVEARNQSIAIMFGIKIGG